MSNKVVPANFEDDDNDESKEKGWEPHITPISHAEFSVISLNNIQALTSGSAKSLGGTIDAMQVGLSNIKQTLSSTDEYVTSKDFKALQENFHLVSTSVTQIEGLIPNLQSIQVALHKVNEFNEKNTEILSDLISGEGKLKGFEQQLITVNNRLNQLESAKSLSTTLKYTGLGILVTIILGALDYAIRLYLGK